MDILADLANEAKRKKPCKVARWVESQTDDEQQQIETAMHSDYSNEIILRVLKRRGAIFSQSALYQHRKGTCTCGH